MAVAGSLSGVAIALGGSWLALAYGQGLGTRLLGTLVIIALVVGAGVSLVSAFFGLVMPRHMHGPWLDPAHWERMHERKRRWREAALRRHGILDEFGEDEVGEDRESPRARRRR